MTEAVIISSARTPFARAFSGALAKATEFDLAKAAVAAALTRSGVDAADVDNIMLGEVYQGGGCIARYAALDLGLSPEVPGVAIGGFCTSGMMAIHHAVAAIRSGMHRCVVAGGVSSVSRSQFVTPSFLQTGILEQECSPSHPNAGASPAMDLVLTLGEGTAKLFNLVREDIDEWAYRAHRLAASAIDDGLFDIEKVAVEVESTEAFDDELPHRGLSLEFFQSMDSFMGPGCTVTVGNQTALTDGAAAMVLCDLEFARSRGAPVLAEVIGWSCTAAEPDAATMAAVTASRRALEVAGLGLDEVDLFEVQDSYASIGVAFERALELDRDKINVYGGGLALGHPYAGSGTRVAGTLINALQRRGGGYGLAAIIGAGGVATAIVLDVRASV
ncbi:thiolase family protein [Mycolicibacterium baixiangningiae]|uniref:thiolase family protein n=1 Tax=Mycolicibacterium baixiangningiae TaxID=2761578 RepID=UPI0018684945|nr:thiolase family protein [Mycolicibacterium baixiangningiae]